jgi:hypothetical protein
MRHPVLAKPMSETQQENTHGAAQSGGPETFLEILEFLVGKVVTVANAESYEDAPVGHRLGAGFYKAKVLQIHADHVVIATQFRHSSGHGEDEPVKQFIPISRVKRVSVMKSEKILHI